MKIYSWNTYCDNKNAAKAADFIASLGADIICLQEVSEELLSRLQKASGFSIVHGTDHIRFQKNRRQECHLVILSKSPILSSDALPMPKADPFPLRSKLFIRMMALTNGLGILSWAEKIANQGILFADTETPDGQKVRVFSLHLRHSGPSERLRDLRAILENKLPGQANIVCGDFNTIYRPIFKIFNWLMGAPFRESLPWTSEKKILGRFLTEEKIKDPLEGQSTHKIFPDQLDHILVPAEWNISEAKVVRDAQGSDHYPISVTIAANSKPH